MTADQETSFSYVLQDNFTLHSEGFRIIQSRQQKHKHKDQS